MSLDNRQPGQDVYLGDGVYASFDGFQIWLAVNHHENKVVAIEPKVMENLVRYATGMWPTVERLPSDDTEGGGGVSGIKASPPDTPEHHIRMARIFLHEAKETIHRDWAFTLLAWAAERRARAAHLKQIGPAQAELFA